MEIVANLLENAFRYSPAGQSIGLNLLDDGLAVWDSGPPIRRPIGTGSSNGIPRCGGAGAFGDGQPCTGQQRARRGLDLLTQPSCLAPDL